MTPLINAVKKDAKTAIFLKKIELMDDVSAWMDLYTDAPENEEFLQRVYLKNSMKDFASILSVAAVFHSKAYMINRKNFNPGHFTASAFVVNPSIRSVAMIFHPKLQLWLAPGGHIEETDRNPQEAAMREAKEEIGLTNLEPIGGVLDLDTHLIPERGDEKPHIHYDLGYHFITQEKILKGDHKAKWMHFSEIESNTMYTRRAWTVIK